jgi:protein-tyrosine phosphatase
LFIARCSNPFPSSKNLLVLSSPRLAAASLECSEITPYLYVAGCDVASNKELLQSHAITRIVNVSAINLPDHFPADFEYTSLALYDHKSQEISWFFLEVIKLVHECRLAGTKCLVHCTQGVSRSVTFCLAYLMILESSTFNEAFTMVKARRSVASPNCGFLCSLLELEKFLKDVKQPDKEQRRSRLFAILPHAEHDQLKLVPKIAMTSQDSTREIMAPGPGLLSELTSCIVLADTNDVFVVHGKRSTSAMRAAAVEFAESANEFFFSRPRNVFTVIEEGEAWGEELTKVMEGGVATGADSMYSNSFAWINSQPNTEGGESDGVVISEVEDVNGISLSVPGENLRSDEELNLKPLAVEMSTDETHPNSLNESGDSLDSIEDVVMTDGPVAPALFQCSRDEGSESWRWDALKVYDDQDLIEEGLFLLVGGEEIYLWAGELFSENNGLGGDSEAILALARGAKFDVSAGKARSANVSNAKIEIQYSESENFYELFEAGY